jgi:phage shock protein PspC (stress-responsive transcriptional regulator)
MNKTVTANISGVVFHIETDAYEKLHQYLTTIRTYFKDSDGTDEIMADIESRIAELFEESLSNGKEVITMTGVQRVIEVMGEPEQYMDEETAEDFNPGSTSSARHKRASFSNRKLFRDPDDNVLGGVCSGLGYYFGVDKIWFRVAFLIALFGFGTGVLLYLLLWIIIPSPKNTAEKLEMKGEPINVENIGNTIKDEFNSFKKKVNEGDTREYGQKAENALYKFFDFLTKLVVFFFKFLGKVIGAVFVFVAIMALIALVVMFVGGPFPFDIHNAQLGDSWTVNIAQIFFSSPTMFYSGLIGLVLVTVIPLIGLLYGGLKILFNISSSHKAINISFASLFVIGVILISISTTSTVAQYSNKQHINEVIPLTELQSDTLQLRSLNQSYSTSNFGSTELYIEGQEILINALEVDIVKSNGEEVELQVRKSSKGLNRKEAGKRAENTLFFYELDSLGLKIDPFISVPLEDQYRDQEIKIRIGLPVGKSIYLSPSSEEIIYDIKNVTNTLDSRMIRHHWLMTEDGLECTDCSWIEKKEEKNTFPENEEDKSSENTTL